MYRFLGDTVRSRTSFDSSRVILESEIARRPDDYRLLQSLAITLAGLGRRDEALRIAVRATEAMPASVDAVAGVWPQISYAEVLVTVGTPTRRSISSNTFCPCVVPNTLPPHFCVSIRSTMHSGATHGFRLFLRNTLERNHHQGSVRPPPTPRRPRHRSVTCAGGAFEFRYSTFEIRCLNSTRLPYVFLICWVFSSAVLPLAAMILHNPPQISPHISPPPPPV